MGLCSCGYKDKGHFCNFAGVHIKFVHFYLYECVFFPVNV